MPFFGACVPLPSAIPATMTADDESALNRVARLRLMPAKKPGARRTLVRLVAGLAPAMSPAVPLPLRLDQDEC